MRIYIRYTCTSCKYPYFRGDRLIISIVPYTTIIFNYIVHDMWRRLVSSLPCIQTVARITFRMDMYNITRCGGDAPVINVTSGTSHIYYTLCNIPFHGKCFYRDCVIPKTQVQHYRQIERYPIQFCETHIYRDNVMCILYTLWDTPCGVVTYDYSNIHLSSVYG